MNNDMYRNEHINSGVYGSRDAYSQQDPYNSNDPYARNNDPYAKNTTQRQQEVKEEKKYPICNFELLLQDKFRGFFNSDLDLHYEKRDYIGDGEILNMVTAVGKDIPSKVFLFLFLTTLSYSLFLINIPIVQISSLLIMVLSFATIIYCPTYFTYITKKYVIGDRTYVLYKQWVNAFKIKIGAILGVSLAVGGVIFIATSYKTQFLEYVKHNSMLKKEWIVKSIEIIPTNTILFLIAYFSLIILYFIFSYFVQKKAEELKKENYKKSALMKLSNPFKRKQAILDGEW